jgi:hypothetical protein
MSENEEVEAAVRSLFAVKDFFVMEDGAKEYSVVYDEKSKQAFRTLYERVKPLGYVPRLFGSKDDAALTVMKSSPVRAPAPRAMVFVALLSAVSIIAAGFFLGTSYAQDFGGSGLFYGVSFVLGVVAVLLTHDLVQRYFARKGGDIETLPYYIPNIPVFLAFPILYFLPTFGAVTFVRSPAFDGDRLFDFYLWGSVAAALVALCVAFAGVPSSIVLSHSQYVAIFGSGSEVFNHGASLLQDLAFDVMTAAGLAPSVPSGAALFLSPLSTAAWVGFLICFFGLMPGALFDGGRMATLVLGERGCRVTTLITAFVLVALDFPNYSVVFLLLFLLAAIRPSNETLDSISGISRSRKLLFVLAMGLLLLCIPVPQTFFTIQI